MLNKCINCCKWITCKNTSKNKYNCQDFKFKRIEYERKEKYGKRKSKKSKKSKKNYKTIM